MNIQSISELNALSDKYEAIRSLSAVLSTDTSAIHDFNEIAPAICTDTDVSNILNKVAFDVLSCKDFYVEASYQSGNSYQSLKFNLGDALSRLAKSLALIAIKNLNALTKERADDLYVPFSGNIGSDKAVSGLWIQQTGAADNTTALSVDGPVFVCNASKQKLLEINPNNSISSSTITINGGTFNASSTSSNFSKLTATEIKATNEISTATLKANSLYAGLSNNTWNFTQQANNITCSIAGCLTANTGNFVNLTATNLTANTAYAGKNSDDKYTLTANGTGVTTSALTAASLACNGNINSTGFIHSNASISCAGTLSSTTALCTGGGFNCAGAIECGGNIHADESISCAGTLSSTTALCTGGGFNCAGAIECGGNIHTIESISCAKNLSSTALTVGGNISCSGTLTVSTALKAGFSTPEGGSEQINLYVPNSGEIKIAQLSSTTIKCKDHLYAGHDSTTWNLDVPNSGTIAINSLAATNLTAGIKTGAAGFNVLVAGSTENKLTLNALNVTATNGLTAAGISELTAKAACWS